MKKNNWGTRPLRILAAVLVFFAAGRILTAQKAMAANPVPTTTGISPTSSVVGAAPFVMTVSGTNFIMSSVVKVDGVGHTTTHVDSSTLQINVTNAMLSAVGTSSITVYNPGPGGGTSNGQIFTVKHALPTIANLSPASTTVGSGYFSLTVAGTGFDASTTAFWNGNARTTSYVDSSTLSVNIHSGDILAAGTSSITVANPAPGGGTSAEAIFTIENPLPAITDVSPSSTIVNSTGTTITVTGTGFIASSTVDWNGSGLTTTFVSSSSLTAAVPDADLTSIATSSITVINPGPGGGTSNSVEFLTYDPIPATFFGMNAGNPNDATDYPPSSTVPIGSMGHPGRFAWATIEVSSGTYNWNFYDNLVSSTVADGYYETNPDGSKTADFFITFAWTPAWALSSTSSCTTGIPTYCTDPPDNIQNWIDFVSSTIDHYNGVTMPHIKYYELWNEANLPGSYTGTKAQLVALANSAYPIIHNDPYSILLTPSVGGSLSTSTAWMQSYLTTCIGASSTECGADYADGGAFHGYQATFPTFPWPEIETTNGSAITRAQGFRSTFDSYGLSGKPMFMTEGSWGQGNVTSSDDQVAWLSRYMILYANTPTKVASWYTWGVNSGWGEIENSDGTPTAAGIAYGQVYHWLTGASFTSIPTTSTAPCYIDAATSSQTYSDWICDLLRPGGYVGKIIWNVTSTNSYTPDSSFVDYQTLSTSTVYSVTSTLTIGSQPLLFENESIP